VISHAFITAAIRLVLHRELRVSSKVNDADDLSSVVGMTIYFQDAAEKLAAVKAAQREYLGWGDYTAAVRLVMKRHLWLHPFLRDDPNTRGRDVLYGPFPENRFRRTEKAASLAMQEISE
jgi:hypothetical protein